MARARVPAWFYVAGTVALTVYGQLIVKWQVDQNGGLPATTDEKLRFLGQLFTNPWVLSALAAAALAAASWMLALTHFELSIAYPFVSLSFVLVLVASAIFFDEGITVVKVAGVMLILLGLFVGSR